MIGAEDVRVTARKVAQVENRDAYLAIRKLFEQGPVMCGRALPRILLSNPDKGDDGKFSVFHYQEAPIGHILFETWKDIDALWATGMGKTVAVSAAEALRMFFMTDKALIVSYTDDQTKFIRDGVHRAFEHGHPVMRDGLLDSPKDEVRVRRPTGEESTLFCRTANVNNDGKTLLGIQGVKTLLLDERSIIPDEIWNEKIDRITAPQGERRLTVGITTTQAVNHVYDLVEPEKLPRGEACNPYIPHITARGGAVFKTTWRDGVKAGRYTQEYIDDRYARLGPEQFAWWYECEFPSRGLAQVFPPDLLRSMIL